MPRCAGCKPNGTPCERIVPASQRYCYSHDPARETERRRNASRAGKSAGGRQIRELKRRISEVVDAVLDGSQDRGRAAVAIQGFNALRGTLELERKVRELEEIAGRLEALERAAENDDDRGGGRRWGT
jgi:antitoxin (DNA-binding transcriptional repressor) of toxin-antitoxin stability system